MPGASDGSGPQPGSMMTAASAAPVQEGCAGTVAGGTFRHHRLATVVSKPGGRWRPEWIATTQSGLAGVERPAPMTIDYRLRTDGRPAATRVGGHPRRCT